MPIPLTKYSKISALHQDLSTNSYIYNQYILTCDISDTQYLDNGTVRSNRMYINSRADYLIHPFSSVTNCVTKFNNEKPLELYEKAYSQIPNLEYRSLSSTVSDKELLQASQKYLQGLSRNNSSFAMGLYLSLIHI